MIVSTLCGLKIYICENQMNDPQNNSSAANIIYWEFSILECVTEYMKITAIGMYNALLLLVLSEDFLQINRLGCFMGNTCMSLFSAA